MRQVHVDFVGQWRRWLTISAALVLVSLTALVLRGLNLSIEFVGGTAFTLDRVAVADLNAEQLREAATAAGAEDVTAQVELDGDTATGALVRTAAVEPGSAATTAIRDALVEVSGAEDVQVSFVGPSWGERISTKALQALAVFLVTVVAYISLRLEFKMAIAAIVALVHDVIATVGVYALAGFNVSPSTVIALLTILGYSLYDSVIVFDRVKETEPQLGEPGRRTYAELVNTSQNEVLRRSLNTSLTSLLPIGTLLFVGAGVLGATTLQDLALALFVGMALGTYSSLFVAGPFLAGWKMREPEQRSRARRLAERVTAGEAPAVVTAGDVAATRRPVTSDYVRGSGKRSRRDRTRR